MLSKKIEVLKITRVHNKGNLRAFVDIQLPDSVTIYDLRIIQQNGQQAWVSAPVVPYEGKDGARKWKRLVDLGLYKNAVEEAVIAAYSQKLGETGNIANDIFA